MVLVFESVIVEYCSVNYVCVINSVILVLYIVCLVLGVGIVDIVWILLIFFVVLSNCVLYCGVSVDFVDIDFEIGNMFVVVFKEKLVIVK